MSAAGGSGASEPMRFCRSRSAGRRCTREQGHRGLHRHRSLMWTDAGADGPECPGSGAPGVAASVLPSGFPDGRALCRVCLGFVAFDAGGRLVRHDAGGGAAEAGERAEWFNSFGWVDSGEATGGDAQSGG
ncbi:hypothetical protein [Microbacterium sp.]|uniref:hypothetical protein n=1 Tax=Microbacterium sp. TaxID=51671 RepID=UPI002E34942F|nr:hypothetical protein [Microbacterium sp.]HEX5727828.1 hypothetical protein [Microbacterium sp.]